MNDSHWDLYLNKQYEGILRNPGKCEHGCACCGSQEDEPLQSPTPGELTAAAASDWLLPANKGAERNTKASPFLQDVGLLRACTSGRRTWPVVLKTLNCSVDEDFLLNHPPFLSPSRQSDRN